METDPLIPFPSADLKNALAERDRQALYWKMKFEVAELERSVVVVKKDQVAETLRGHEV